MIKPIYLFGKRIDVNVAPAPAPAPALLPVPEFLFSKALEHSDIAPSQSRILMPSCPNLEKFLTEEEKREKEEPSSSLSPSSSSSSSPPKKKKKGVQVEMKDSEGRSFGLSLKYWTSLKKFVLNKGWNLVVKENGLHQGDVISVWCDGRNHENKLCFHMKIVREVRH